MEVKSREGWFYFGDKIKTARLFLLWKSIREEEINDTWEVGRRVGRCPWVGEKGKIYELLGKAETYLEVHNNGEIRVYMATDALG